MKIAVVGCGGIGGVVACALASKGLNVTCIEVVDKAVQVLNEDGIRLEGKKGCHHVRVRAFSRLSNAKESFDTIVIAVKSNSLASAFEDACYHLCKDGFILTLQNGLEILGIAERHPDVRIVGGAVGYNAQMLEFGRYRVSSEGGITVGNISCATEGDVFLLKSVFEPLIQVETTTNIRGVLWAKLLVVCGVTGLGGASGLLVGELLKKRIARRLFYQIVTEGVLVARKLEVRIEKFAGRVNPEKFANLKGGYPLLLRWMLLNVVGMKYMNLKSNIHHDLERGQNTEVDFLNGKILMLGEITGIPTPANRKLVEVVKEIEDRKRPLSPENLSVIWNAVQREKEIH